MHALAIRNAFLNRIELVDGMDEAEDRALEREEARRRARENPSGRMPSSSRAAPVVRRLRARFACGCSAPQGG